MRRYYRLTGRSLPQRRRSLISESTASSPLTIVVLGLASLVGAAAILSFPDTPRATATVVQAVAPVAMAPSATSPEPQATTLPKEFAEAVTPSADLASMDLASADSGPSNAAVETLSSGGDFTSVRREEPEHTISATRNSNSDVPQKLQAPVRRSVLAGTWAPNRAACDKRVADRSGWLPMRISDRGAHAGKTTCSFRKLQGTGNELTATAECAGPRGQWTSNVRLKLAASTLTWSSVRGTRHYVRCDRVQVAAR
jgi:hypothetical protein